MRLPARKRALSLTICLSWGKMRWEKGAMLLTSCRGYEICNMWWDCQAEKQTECHSLPVGHGMWLPDRQWSALSLTFCWSWDEATWQKKCSVPHILSVMRCECGIVRKGSVTRPLFNHHVHETWMQRGNESLTCCSSWDEIYNCLKGSITHRLWLMKLSFAKLDFIPTHPLQHMTFYSCNVQCYSHPASHVSKCRIINYAQNYPVQHTFCSSCHVSP